VFLISLTSAISIQAAPVLSNGDFENEPNFGSGVSNDPGFSALTGTQIPGWTIAAGHAATIHNTNLYPFITGNYSLNIDGEGFNGHNADLFQDFASSSGAAYELTFDWQGWMNNAPSMQLHVSITDLTTDDVLYNGLFGYSATLHHEIGDFVGTGNTLRLEIQETPESGFNDNQFVVDNFSVEAVPEPATTMLLIVGATALSAAIRLTKRS
jgi:hypothetical protein